VSSQKPRSINDEIALSLRSIPFPRAIGMTLVDAGPDFCKVKIPYEARFNEKAGTQAVSPGLLAGVLDQLGSGALTAYFAERHAKATLSMSLSFAKDLAVTDEIHCIGRTRFETGTTGSIELSAQTSDGSMLAHGLVSFMIGAYPGSASGTSAHDHSRRAVREKFVPEGVKAASFDEWMGIELGENPRLPNSIRLTGSTGPVVAFHGGVVAAAGISGASQKARSLGEFSLSHFTLEYLRAAKAQPLFLEVEVLRETRRTLVCRTDLFQEDGARHVATTTARFVR
jgi:acyl-coenzyme A thioesterase PaaI-like protein